MDVQTRNANSVIQALDEMRKLVATTRKELEETKNQLLMAQDSITSLRNEFNMLRAKTLGSGSTT